MPLRTNLTHPVSRGLVTGLVVPLVFKTFWRHIFATLLELFYLIMILFGNFLNLLKKEINKFFVERKVTKVKSLVTGSKQNLWKAVRVARDLIAEMIPSNLTLGMLHLLI